MLTALSFTGCTSNEDKSAQLTEFRNTVDTFCETIASLDSSINNAGDSDDTASVLSNLDTLNTSFAEFASVDFPKDYDYLENLADEAADYMSTAVTSYHQAFEQCTDKESFENKYNYAGENYSRAYKRINVIVSFLNGETTDDATIVTE
ncbi:MAG: hypothetical protein K5669_10255 [Lachnospiraceae bacterium]|nr:hypothetical protein [Lachnospiraceae bacterium]